MVEDMQISSFSSFRRYYYLFLRQQSLIFFLKSYMLFFPFVKVFSVYFVIHFLSSSYVRFKTPLNLTVEFMLPVGHDSLFKVF
ncbi:hypothetical protein ACS0TY_003990 [Phlomoides rotata]